MTHSTTKSRKPLPLFYVGEVVYVGRKLVTVKVADGRLMSLPFEQVDIY
jgi:hypothetical protein